MASTVVAAPGFLTSRGFDAVDDDILEKLLKPQASESLQKLQSLSRQSTEDPNEYDDVDEDEFDDAYVPGVGKINVSFPRKSFEQAQVEGDPDEFPSQELLEYTQGVSDQKDNILKRKIVCDRKSHWKYFEDASWQTFDPEFAQWFVQSPLRSILEDGQQTDDEETNVCFIPSL